MPHVQPVTEEVPPVQPATDPIVPPPPLHAPGSSSFFRAPLEKEKGKGKGSDKESGKGGEKGRSEKRKSPPSKSAPPHPKKTQKSPPRRRSPPQRRFYEGESSRSRFSYATTRETQSPNYPCSHPQNYGTKFPLIAETDAVRATLRMISGYPMDRYVKEVGQNITNLAHLFIGRLSSMSNFRDTHSLENELRRAKHKIKDLDDEFYRKCLDMATVNKNFKKLDEDWTAQSHTLKKTLQDLSKVRGECGALKIELTTEQAKVRIKDVIVDGVQCDIKATGESFDVMIVSEIALWCD